MKNILSVMTASLALALAIPANATPNEAARVHIWYRQAANFQSYKTAFNPNGSNGAGVNAIFVMYKIEAVENTGAAGFAFHRRRAVTIGHGTSEADADSLLGPRLMAEGKVIAANSSTNSNLGCIIKLVSGNLGTASQAQALIDLRYRRSDPQPVTMHKSNNNSPPVLFHADATAEQLQNACW